MQTKIIGIKTRLSKACIAFKVALANNKGVDEELSKTRSIVIGFVIGAIVLGILLIAFNGPITEWFNSTIASWYKSGGEVRPS